MDPRSSVIVPLLLALGVIVSCAGTPATMPCDRYCHVNLRAPIPPPAQPAAYTASLSVRHDIDPQCRSLWMPADSSQGSIQECSPERGHKADPNFIGLALSGGGSRAAVFSAAAMFELQKRGILQHIDVISAASGGSITAALYATSCDAQSTCPPTSTGLPRHRWDENEIFNLVNLDIRGSWIKNWFIDINVYRYYWTSFDRTDIMAQTLTQNLYGNSRDPAQGLTFRDLNPQRPYLILNATNNTDSLFDPALRISDDPFNRRWFSFTQEHFAKIASDLDAFPLAYAVAASAAFPMVFNHVTLQNYSRDGYMHIHLLDAGIADNQAAGPLRHLCTKEPYRSARKLMILIDVQMPEAAAESDHDPRKSLDYVIDTNIQYAYSIMMDTIREQRVMEFRNFLEENNGRLIHVRFEDLGMNSDLYKSVRNIKTDLKITPGNVDILRQAAKTLVGKAVEELSSDAYWKTQFNLP